MLLFFCSLKRSIGREMIEIVRKGSVAKLSQLIGSQENLQEHPLLALLR